MSARERFDGIVRRMKPGQYVRFDQWFIDQAFGSDRNPYAALLMDTRGDQRDRIMSSLIGSAHGCWTVTQDIMDYIWTIGRHEGRSDDVITYVDPDRRYLYDKQPDGTWVRNSIEYRRQASPK